MDLEAALEDLLASKATSSPPPSELLTAESGQQLLAAALQQATPPPPPVLATSQQRATAPPAAQAGEAEAASPEAVPPTASDTPASFGGLSNAFLKAMQASLEQQGHDLTSSAVMSQLAADPSLPAALLSSLAGIMGGADPAWLAELVRQWQRAIQQQMELEQELAKKQQRPVWRCAACGRYGCPVAPYIERYEEV